MHSFFLTFFIENWTNCYQGGYCGDNQKGSCWVRKEERGTHGEWPRCNGGNGNVLYFSCEQAKCLFLLPVAVCGVWPEELWRVWVFYCSGACGGSALLESQTQYPAGPEAQPLQAMLCSGAPSKLSWGNLSELWLQCDTSLLAGCFLLISLTVCFAWQWLFLNDRAGSWHW